MDYVGSNGGMEEIVGVVGVVSVGLSFHSGVLFPNATSCPPKCKVFATWGSQLAPSPSITLIYQLKLQRSRRYAEWWST